LNEEILIELLKEFKVMNKTLDIIAKELKILAEGDLKNG